MPRLLKHCWSPPMPRVDVPAKDDGGGWKSITPTELLAALAFETSLPTPVTNPFITPRKNREKGFFGRIFKRSATKSSGSEGTDDNSSVGDDKEGVDLDLGFDGSSDDCIAQEHGLSDEPQLENTHDNDGETIADDSNVESSRGTESNCNDLPNYPYNRPMLPPRLRGGLMQTRGVLSSAWNITRNTVDTIVTQTPDGDATDESHRATHERIVQTRAALGHVWDRTSQTVGTVVTSASEFSSSVNVEDFKRLPRWNTGAVHDDENHHPNIISEEKESSFPSAPRTPPSMSNRCNESQSDRRASFLSAQKIERISTVSRNISSSAVTLGSMIGSVAKSKMSESKCHLNFDLEESDQQKEMVQTSEGASNNLRRRRASTVSRNLCTTAVTLGSMIGSVAKNKISETKCPDNLRRRSNQLWSTAAETLGNRIGSASMGEKSETKCHLNFDLEESDQQEETVQTSEGVSDNLRRRSSQLLSTAAETLGNRIGSAVIGGQSETKCHLNFDLEDNDQQDEILQTTEVSDNLRSLWSVTKTWSQRRLSAALEGDSCPDPGGVDHVSGDEKVRENSDNTTVSDVVLANGADSAAGFSSDAIQ